MVNELIAGMAQRLGLSLELNDEGACRLVFEDKYTVDIQVQEGQENRFYFVSTVGQAEAPTERSCAPCSMPIFSDRAPARRLSPMTRIWRKFCPALFRCAICRSRPTDGRAGRIRQYRGELTERLDGQGAEKSGNSAEATALAQGDPCSSGSRA